MKRLIILLLIYSSIYSQTQILEGTVLNSENYEPIQFCNVSVGNQDFSTITNNEGKFYLKGNFKDEDLIIFLHLGFIKKSISVSDFNKLFKKIIFLESKIFNTQTILVKGLISEEGKTPISFSKVKREEFIKSYTLQDIPEVLNYLPSTNFYSENGNGIGYNYLSIRGFDQRRISVAINGVPQNDPEDHNVYWIDFPDLIEQTDLIQVQRGAGNGIIGYPSIGGSVNIITSTFSDKKKLEFVSSIGSYNTRKYGLSFSSGLIENSYSFSGRISQILSSGYRNLSWVDLKSFNLSLVKYDYDLTTQINIYGGPISDGLAYTGLPKFAIKDKNLRRQNYSYWEESNNQITYKTERRPEEKENFSQPHFEILNNYKINENINLSSVLFLVLGNGFFDYDASWADTTYLRITNENGFKPKQNPTEAIIRAMVENKQFGWLPKINLKHENGELIVGGEFRFHKSLHWGSLNYANNLPDNFSQKFRYYQYNGAKDIVNFFINENFQLSNEINLLGELQLSYNKYKFYNEKYLNNSFNVNNVFINPRFGINYKLNKNISSYFNIAFVQREPRLKNYYDAAESSGGAVPQFFTNQNGDYDFNSPLVKPEKMFDIELGTSYQQENIFATLNFYYMSFKDEIVKKGQLDRFGQPITGNMDKTTHYGIESTFNFRFNKHLDFILNSSFSKNYIAEGFTYVKTKDIYGNKVTAKINLKDNSISGFANSIINGIIRFSFEEFYLQLSGKYVSSFYTDNFAEKLPELLKQFPRLTNYPDNKVDSFYHLNFFASYDFYSNYLKTKFTFFLQVNNLTNNLYAAYGIGGEFFPSAERNYLFGVKINL